MPGAATGDSLSLSLSLELSGHVGEVPHLDLRTDITGWGPCLGRGAFGAVYKVRRGPGSGSAVPCRLLGAVMKQHLGRTGLPCRVCAGACIISHHGLPCSHAGALPRSLAADLAVAVCLTPPPLPLALPCLPSAGPVPRPPRRRQGPPPGGAGAQGPAGVQVGGGREAGSGMCMEANCRIRCLASPATAVHGLPAAYAKASRAHPPHPPTPAWL